MLSTALLALSANGGADLAADLAKPLGVSTQLASSPPIWLTHDFLSPAVVAHMKSLVPTEDSAYSPCIGQVTEFVSKRCTRIPVKGDAILEAVIDKVEHYWNVDTTRLREGLPVIRYLPGAPQVGHHGDEDRHGVVPNATLVMYLTEADTPAASGQTVFPEANVKVTPRQGSILSFQNVDSHGAPHPKAKHLVSAVSAEAKADRLVVQIPIAHRDGVRAYAYPEHVSGGKKPGQHESMHGSDAQKAAYQAAIAAGVGLGLAYMAAKAGKFEESDIPKLKQEAQDTGKFTEDELKEK